MNEAHHPRSKQAMYEEVKKTLTDKRYRHTLGVVESAIKLAKQYGADVEKAEVAAIYHDYAKFRSREEMIHYIRSVDEIPTNLLDYHQELWHSFVGAYLVQTEQGIKDGDVLAAIRYHTTGRAGMSLVEKVVCLADYIEPGRQFPGVEEVRRLAEQDLERALAQCFSNTIQFLKRKGEKVYPLTLEAYEWLDSSGEK